MADTDVDRNLLFAVIAFQDDLIDQDRFVDVCAGWAARMHLPLADLLLERNWINQGDRLAIDRKIERKIQKHGGARASLAALAGADARDVIRRVDHPEICKSLSSLPPPSGHVLLETVIPPHRPEQSRYSLTRMHAKGGLGRVWLARDGNLRREVALKEILPESAADPETWRRFLKEAQVTGQLEHPNIVPVYELARRNEDDQPFYVMRFVRGQSLLDALRDFHRDRAGKPPERLALQGLLSAFLKVCDAVAYAHSRGVIHRDLKPENIVLGGFGEVIVLDWGLAKLVDDPEDPGECETRSADRVSVSDEAHTEKTHGQMGTPCYMAPEQVELKQDLIDDRTDVYALGGILFETLTGHPPAEGTTTAEVFDRITSGRIPLARQLEPGVPRGLEAICAKALAKDRAGRYKSVKNLADDVRRWVADEPVSAWREPWWQHFSRWARRNRSWVAAAAGALVVVSIVSSLAAILIDGARRQESIARADAGRRLNQARESIDVLLTGVGEGLAKVPGAQRVRRNLLEKAATQYRQLATEKGDDPALRFESGLARARLGSIRFDLGDKAGAESDFRAADLDLSRLPISFNDFQVGLTLCGVRANLGVVLKNQGRLNEAEKAYRAVIDDGLALLKANADVAKVSYWLGFARTRLASMLADTKHLEEAEELFRAAVANLNDAAKAGEYRSRDKLAASLCAYAELLKKLGRVADAEVRYRASIATASETIRLMPEEFEARNQLAINLHNLGLLLVELGRGDEAERLYLASLTEREALARANPDVPDYVFFRASSRSVLGVFYMDRNRYREAEDRFRAAVSDMQALVRDHPDIPFYRKRLGTVRSNFSRLFMAMGRYPEAEAEARLLTVEQRKSWDSNPTVLTEGADLGKNLNTHACILRRLGRLDEAGETFRAGLDVYERLAKEEPTVPGHSDMLALISNNVADLLKQRNQLEAALPMARRAVAGYETLTRDHPKELDYAESLVMSRMTLGSTLAGQGMTDEAHNVLSSAAATAENLVSSHPDVPLLVQRLVESKTVLAQVDSSLGHFGNAIKTLDSATRQLRAALDRDPMSAEFRAKVWSLASERAEILLKHGRVAQAVESLESLSGEPCPVGSLYYNVACLYARAAKVTAEVPQVSAEQGREARARAYNDHAVELLRKASSAGFREASQFAQDDDLAPLRSRPDFQVLMMDLAFPAKPFARGD
jgi:eukaryotic-like serine/threonine-protein kinase